MEKLESAMLEADDVKYIAKYLGRDIVIVNNPDNQSQAATEAVRRYEAKLDELQAELDAPSQPQANPQNSESTLRTAEVIQKDIEDNEKWLKAAQQNFQNTQSNMASFRVYEKNGKISDPCNNLLADDYRGDEHQEPVQPASAADKQNILRTYLDNPNTIVLYQVNGNHFMAVQPTKAVELPQT
jgi:hypothetical protein